MADRAIYYVLSSGAQWKVRFNGVDYSYRTQQDAIDAARTAAKTAYSRGHNSQVLVQRPDGRWRTEWTYGDDPRRTPG